MFRFGVDKPGVGLLRPRNLAFARGFFLQLLQTRRVIAEATPSLGILNLMLRCLNDNRALSVITCAAGTACNLMKLTRFEDALARAVILGQARHKHRADRHVNAHTQGVSATDDLEQALLCQALH